MSWATENTSKRAATIWNKIKNFTKAHEWMEEKHKKLGKLKN
jgi:hypothetical protein